MPSRRPSGRTTRTSSGGWCSSSATSTTPRTSRRTRTCGRIDRWARFDGVDVRGWLYTIALRLAFNHLRGRRRWLAAIGRVEARPGRDPTDPDLWAALRGLEPRTRTALLLNVLDGYTQAEIGAMLGVPEGTVASWLSRGRSALRKELGPDR